MSSARIGSSAYFDASALFKLAIEEEESDALRRALSTLPRRASSRVGVVEVLRAVRRRRRSAEPLARQVLARTSLIRLDDRVLEAAVSLDPAPLRTLDAIHIATALRLGPQLAAFVSYDVLQLRAAEAIGLPVASPR